MTKPVRLVVLDRDGVINRAPESYVLRAKDWLPETGAVEAIAELCAGGFTVVVATNQSCIGRGLVSDDEMKRIHDRMTATVRMAGGRIDRIWVCPHSPDAGCACRKPKTGMLRSIAEYYGVPIEGVPVVGDADTDLLAATAAGARPILVLTGKGASTRQTMEGILDFEVCEDLAAVAGRLVNETGG